MPTQPQFHRPASPRRLPHRAFVARTIVSVFLAASAPVAMQTADAVEPAAAPGNAKTGTAPRETVTPAFAHPIANVPGKTLTSLIVTYPPGGTTPSHRHGGAFVVGDVLEGAIRSRLGDGSVKVYKAGESWTEEPGAHHTMSENASATEPAKMIAVFVAHSSERDLLTFDKH